MFKDRLVKYRNELGLTKKELSEQLDYSDSYYNLIESGKRVPSEKFITSLVAHSHKPEEYWIYGIDPDGIHREDLKNTRNILEMIASSKIIKNASELFDGLDKNAQLEKLIIAAIKADLSYMLEEE